MKRIASSTLAFSSIAVAVACGGSDPTPNTASTAPSASVSGSAMTSASTPIVASAAPSAEPPKPAGPTEEEKKKAAKQAEIDELRTSVEVRAYAEAARWTPAMHAEAKKLAETKYPSLKAALVAAMKGHYRKPGSAERDKYRHPIETLSFFGVTPKMTVLEFGPGEGWFTELLAPTLAAQGKLYITSANPDGPSDQRQTVSGLMLKLFLDNAPELYGKVERLIVDGMAAPALPLPDGKIDFILLTRELHGMQNSGKLAGWLAEYHRVLKPGGIIGVEQHRAPKDAKAEESSKKGYLPQDWVVAQFEAAGFKLVASSEINANPKDTKDYPEGVWTLPPSYELKDKDHDKYAAIGESDRMTLKFVRVDAKK